MQDLKKAYVCRVGERCMGLLLHYHKKPPAVLGQWHPVDLSEHVCIYDNEMFGPANIYFKTAPRDVDEIVVDIGFSIDKDEACQESN